MKLTKLAVIGFITFGAIASVTQTVSAATIGTAEPKATVKFEEENDDNNNGVIILPDTQPQVEVKPEIPVTSATGPLMITQAPTFDFGTVAIKAVDAKYSAKAAEYKQKTGENPDGTPIFAADSIYSAPLLEVKDARGNADGAWTVTVKASEFVSDDAVTANQKKLAGAAITLKNAKVFNNMLSENGTSAVEIDPNGINAKTSITINGTEQTILGAKGGSGQALTSYVADSNYTGTTATNYTGTDKINDIELHVPVTAEKDKTKNYVATVTWTLSDDPAA
ncbi:MAG: WxL domain-containing protein [Carnobacterium sp.]|uniref:WxL domain-containing protein n=1 Tax=Carnobacterium sp. TaxID=48221 RepID=UPI00257A01EE|nr:WxL domain-containing protein [Carnobacterium sp.]MBQ6485356.1 WxL domain-containing protein [Carnobacterium sp.]